MKKIKKGKFIVIEGVDGSGKETQAKLLIKKLQDRGFKIKVMDFPQYGKTLFGDMVGKFLKGEYGSLKDVNPYLASLTYAGDRWQAKDEINDYLKKGYVVVSNRYALSNMGHQGSKLFGKQRKDLLNFLEKLEYEIYDIPREDLDVILDVPAKIGKELILKKTARKYLGERRRRDIHEANVNYQEVTRKVYLGLLKRHPYIKKVDCSKRGKLLSIEEIHNRVWNVVSKHLGIK